MKIAITLAAKPQKNSNQASGENVFWNQLAPRLIKKNHQLTFVFAKQDLNVPFLNDISLCWKIRKQIERLEASHDLVITDGFTGAFLRHIKTPRINLTHATACGFVDIVAKRYSGYTILVEKNRSKLEQLSTMNALNIATSLFVRDELKELHGIDSLIIHNGVDTKRFEPVTSSQKIALRAEFGFPSDSKILLFVGRPQWQKGWNLFLEMSKLIRAKFSDVFFVGVIGEELKIPGIRTMSEHHSEIHRVFQASDIFLLPSFHEGNALSLLEAMACGLPFVSFDTGLAYEYREQSEFKWIIASLRRPQSFIKKLVSLLNSFENLDYLGKICRETALRYDWDKTALEYDSLFRLVKNK